jgi:hypothetical protein
MHWAYDVDARKAGNEKGCDEKRPFVANANARRNRVAA